MIPLAAAASTAILFTIAAKKKNITKLDSYFHFGMIGFFIDQRRELAEKKGNDPTWKHSPVLRRLDQKKKNIGDNI